MNRHEPGQSSGDDLRRVLHDTVDDLEPRPGLDAIRARTREQRSGNGRPWLLGAFGAAVATAAVVAGVAVLGGDPRPTADPPPAGQVTPSATTSQQPTDGATDGSTTGASDTVAAPVYFAGDTNVFGDMALIKRLYAPDVAVLPIGDHYTMGPDEAALAAELVGASRVVPSHYGTFPLLTGTPDALRPLLSAGVELLAPAPGETLTL